MVEMEELMNAEHLDELINAIGKQKLRGFVSPDILLETCRATAL